MRRILSLFLTVSSVAGFAQQAPLPASPNAIIERVDVSGIPDTRLTAELRADIQKLAGQTYNPDTARQLAEGIQIELPEYVAAATLQPGSQADRIRLMFLVAKIADNDALKTNINSRYIVETVEVAGKFNAKVSGDLTSELQKMVGQNLDNAKADSLAERIRQENEPEILMVERKLRRGATAQHVKVVYDVHKAENTVGFNGSLASYHSMEGFGGPELWANLHHLGWGTLTFRTNNNPDELIERFIGGGIGYSAKYRDFGFNLEYTSYRAQWKNDTLQADRQSTDSPGLYRLRDTLQGSAGLKLPGKLYAGVGVSFSELEMQSRTAGFQKANAWTASLSQAYGRAYEVNEPSHSASWQYRIQAGTGSLDSDFIYTRHQVSASYSFMRNKKPVFGLNAVLGRITGNAPMFQRFSLGNARTLRGWTKYEISPLGGNRQAYASASYTFLKFFTPFYDVGSVWNAGQPATVRQSVGIRVMPPCKGAMLEFPLCHVPFTVGFPIRGGHAQPMFSAGF